MAAIVTTPLQLAGFEFEAFWFSLPAATITEAPRLRAVSIADCVVDPQAPPPPRLRFSTSAGLALAGTPLTDPPAAQMMPSAMSEV